MTRLNQFTLSELSQMLEQGKCSSSEIVEDLISAVEAGDERIGSYLQLAQESIREGARQADARRSSGEEGKLLGLPIGIKDILNVKGEPCRCASKILEGYTAPYDATSIAKLRDARAILAGRLNMDEFAMGSSTENSAFQITRNPWDTTRVPGGSSGGSAASVAADLAIATLGSDTGGSIRQPAAFCGCVGLKPTYGRVSRYGLTAFASSLDQIGPITKTVRDAALVLEAISGHDPLDSTSVDLAVPDYTSHLDSCEDLKGMKLGLPKEYFIEGLDPQTERAVRQAVEQCRQLGAEIVDVSLPHTKYSISVYYIIATAEASSNLARFDGIRYGLRSDESDLLELYKKSKAAGFGSEVKRRIILGTYVLSSGYYDAYYLRAQKVRTLIREDFKKAFQECDALLTPCTPTPAYPIGSKTADPLEMYLDDILTTPSNLAGICGLSLPCGFSQENLPIGLQILGPSFKEENILKVAHLYEQATDWHTKKPEF